MDLIPTEQEIKALQAIAISAHKSSFFKIANSEGMFCIALMARELGISPMVALTGGIRYILGKVELSPQLMNSLVRQRGHTMEILESTTEKCVIKGIRKDSKETYVCEFSIEDAKKAGLIKKDSGWEKYPSDMLFARCLSRLARRLFPDVIGPSYVQGEIGAAEQITPPAAACIPEIQSEETQKISQETQKAIEEFHLPEERIKKMLALANVSRLEDMSEKDAQECLSMLNRAKKKTEEAKNESN